MAYVVDVEARIKDDPTTAREALRQARKASVYEGS